MGVDNAAINALVDGLVLAESQEDFVARAVLEWSSLGLAIIWEWIMRR